MNILELKDITKAFRDGEGQERVILDRFNLTVAAGEFIAVTGPSGAGKTTLLHIIGSLLPPDSGTVLLEGKDLYGGGLDLPAIRNRRIGFVFQDHRLLPQLTILQNILLPTLVEGEKASEEQGKRAESLMEYMGIKDLANRYPETVSGGEASRAALCRALIMQPALLLADEPTGQLDKVHSHRIATLFKQIATDFGTTVVMVTHSSSVAAAADRIVTLDKG